MALFPGEDLVDVPTPDGRVLKLPRSAVPASAMPQQIGQTPQGFTDETSYNVNEPFQSPNGDGLGINTDQNGIIIPPRQAADNAQQALGVMGAPLAGALGGAGTAVANAAGQSQRQISDVVDRAPTDAQRVAKAKQDAYNASPAGQKAAAEAAQKSAYEAEAQHAKEKADIDAAGQDMIAQAYTERNQDLDKLFAQRAKDAQADYEAEQGKLAEIGAMRKKIENTKIDHTADHPILAAIGIALSGLGSAMKKQDTNPAIEILWKAIDRKVHAQMQDLDLLKEKYGLSTDELKAFKDKSSRHLELYNTLLAGEADKAAKHIEALGARLQGAQTQANAKMYADQIRQRGSAAGLDAARWSLDYDQKDRHQKQQLGLGYSQLGETRRHNMAEEQLTRKNIYLDYQKGLASIKATGDQARYKAALEAGKENDTRGIGNAITGGTLMTKAGMDQMKQADDMEKQAKALEDAPVGPMGRTSEQNARIQMYRDKASELRGTAQLEGTFRFNDPVQAGKFSDQMASGQQITSLVDDINALYDAAGGGKQLAVGDNRAAIQAKATELAMNLKTAWQLGVLSKNDVQLLGQATGGFDPEKIDQSTLENWVTGGLLGTQAEAFKKRLGTLADDTQRALVYQLHAHRWDVTDPDQIKALFHRTTAAGDTPEGKVIEGLAKGQGPVAAEAAQAPTTAGKVRDQIWSAGGLVGEPQYKVNQEQAANNGSIKYPGLGANQEVDFGKALDMYKSGNQKIGPLLVAQVANMATTRPDDAVGMLHALHDNARKLYEQAVMALPEGSPAQIQIAGEAKTRVAVADTPTEILGTQLLASLDNNGKVTDQTGWDELSRRAQATGPGAASAKAVMGSIIKESGKRKLPQGSVFRGGN